MDELDEIDSIISSIGGPDDQKSDADVMGDLDKIVGDLKVSDAPPLSSGGGGGGGGGASGADELDDIIEGLKTADPVKLDMEESVPQVSKPKQSVHKPAGGGGGGGGGGPCVACGKAVDGPHTSTTDGTYHATCFQCDICDKTLDGDYFTYEKKPHCRSCYGEVFRCQRCKKQMDGEYLTRDGKYYHKDCLPARKCARCRTALSGTAMKALKQYWHPHCFKCADCGSEVDKYYVNKQQQPECQKCWERKNPVAVCYTCKKRIDGEYLTHKRKSYHKPCFNCATCSASLAGGQFYDVDGKAMCEPCAQKVA